MDSNMVHSMGHDFSMGYNMVYTMVASMVHRMVCPTMYVCFVTISVLVFARKMLLIYSKIVEKPLKMAYSCACVQRESKSDGDPKTSRVERKR